MVDLAKDGDTYLPLGDARVPFDSRSVSTVKSSSALSVMAEGVGVKVLGFKPEATLRMEERVGRAHLLQPAAPKKGEPVPKGNRGAAVALQQAMLKKGGEEEGRGREGREEGHLFF